MELRHLRYFVAIAEERSFTRAAERLWTAQPGLSSQIRRLESELGVRLLERHSRGVDLTDAGRLFLERARTTLVAADLARSTGTDLEAGLVGRLRLGVAGEAPPASLPAMLASFGREFPDIEVSVLQSYAGALLRDLRDERLDAVVAPSTFGSAELLTQRLGAEPWVVLVSPRHRLGEPGPIDIDQLVREPVIVTGHRDGAGYDRAVTQMLADLGLSPALVHGGSGPALIAELSAGRAVALSTSSGATGELLARPLEPLRHVRFALLARNEPPSPALRELLRIAAPTRSRPPLALAS